MERQTLMIGMLSAVISVQTDAKITTLVSIPFVQGGVFRPQGRVDMSKMSESQSLSFRAGSFDWNSNSLKY